MINEIEYVAIDPRILNLKDDRIEKYKNGEWTQEQLLSSITNNDPFYIESGVLKLIVNADQPIFDNIKNKEDKIKEFDPLKIWDEREKYKVNTTAINIINNIEEDLNNFNSNIAKYRRVKPLTEYLIEEGIL